MTEKCEKCGHAAHVEPCKARHIKMVFLSAGAIAETITECGCIPPTPGGTTEHG